MLDRGCDNLRRDAVAMFRAPIARFPRLTQATSVPAFTRGRASDQVALVLPRDRLRQKWPNQRHLLA